MHIPSAITALHTCARNPRTHTLHGCFASSVLTALVSGPVRFYLSYSPAPAYPSRSSPFVSLRAIRVPSSGANRPSRLLGSASSCSKKTGNGPHQQLYL